MGQTEKKAHEMMLVKNLEDGMPSAEETLLAYVEKHWLDSCTESRLFELLMVEKCREAVSNILLKCIELQFFCRKHEKVLIELLNDDNYRDIAKGILLKYTERWGIHAIAITMLIKLTKSASKETAAAAEEIFKKTREI